MKPPQHAIREDVHCASCGYNLRGLPPIGKCPECGDSIRASLRLRWMSEPANRLRHQHGLAMQITAIALMVLCGLPFLVIASFVVRFHVPLWVYHGALLLVSATIAVATFTATRTVDGAQQLGLRWPLRIAAAVTTAILLVLNTLALAISAFPWMTNVDLWRHACTSGLATLLLFAIQVMPSTRGIESLAHHGARGLGFATIAVLAAFLAVNVTLGLEAAGCASVLLAFACTVSSTAFFWFVGRELWS